MGKRIKRAKKPLRSLAILEERSAIPSLSSRAKPSQPKGRKTKITAKEKERLRRTALKAEADGTADIKTTDVSSLHDAWGAEEAEPSLPGGYGEEAVVKRKIKAPETLERQRELRRAVDSAQLAAELPRAGVSYNPSAPAHAALIDEAVQQEMERLAAEERLEKEIAARGGVVDALKGQDDWIGDEVVQGMRIGRGDGVALEDDEEESEPEVEAYKPKPTKRKTQAQRNKAARAKAQLLAEREEANRRRIEKHIGAAKSMSKSVAAKAREAEEAARQRKLAAALRERAGFAGGEKVGKHRVQKGSVAVQLGEDLAESLRQVKVSSVDAEPSVCCANPSPRATSSRTASSRCSVAHSSSLVCPSCPRSASSRSRSTRSSRGSGSSKPLRQHAVGSAQTSAEEGIMGCAFGHTVHRQASRGRQRHCCRTVYVRFLDGIYIATTHTCSMAFQCQVQSAAQW